MSKTHIYETKDDEHLHQALDAMHIYKDPDLKNSSVKLPKLQHKTTIQG